MGGAMDEKIKKLEAELKRLQLELDRMKRESYDFEEVDTDRYLTAVYN